MFVFSGVPIGHYAVSAGTPAFETTVQQNITLHVADRLNINMVLKAGSVTETVTVTTAPPLLQDREASVNEVMDTETINTPLAERNWVYGALPPFQPSDLGKPEQHGSVGNRGSDYVAAWIAEQPARCSVLPTIG